MNTSKTPAHLLRYESQLNRTYDRALKQLKDLQAMQSAARPAPALVKPNTPTHLPEPPNEPGERVSSLLHPPEAPPAEAQNREEGVQILAA